MGHQWFAVFAWAMFMLLMLIFAVIVVYACVGCIVHLIDNHRLNQRRIPNPKPSRFDGARKHD